MEYTDAANITMEEARGEMREAVQMSTRREALSKVWGHEGFAVSIEEGRFWLILNPDRKTAADYVIVTVYTNSQYQARQKGEWLKDTDLNRTPLGKSLGVTPPLGQAPMIYRVECKNEETKEFDNETDCIKHLAALADNGHTADDWAVWKRVKTEVRLTD